MKVAKNLVFKIETEIEIIEIHAVLKLKYSKQSKFKSNWPHISVIEIAIEIEIHFKIEITLPNYMFAHWQTLEVILVLRESSLSLQFNASVPHAFICESVLFLLQSAVLFNGCWSFLLRRSVFCLRCFNKLNERLNFVYTGLQTCGLLLLLVRVRRSIDSSVNKCS
jgi:hypothetical protein